jgi:hypothetical protein
MAKISAKDGIILVGGYNVGFDAASYEIAHNVEMLDATGFGEGWQNYVAGKYTGQMSVNFFWNAVTGRANAGLIPLSAGQNVTIIPEGYALGNQCWSMYAANGNFTPGGGANTMLTAGNIVFNSTGVDAGPLPSVVLAHAEISNTATGTGFLDPANDAVTARCTGTLHVWTACATDTYSFKIQHSDTLGSGYADLVTFTLNGTSATSQNVDVASGTINKYRRTLVTRLTGAGQTLGYSITFWRA